MRLGVEPQVFLGRVVVLFVLAYLAFKPLAPVHTQLLGWLTQGFLHVVETSSDPMLHHASEVRVEGGGIVYRNRHFPQAQPPAIPADWVQANLVLLIPLMLATPAPTWRRKGIRLALALGITLVLQVIDVAFTVKAFQAYDLEAYSFHYYSDFERQVYGFADAFAQSMDTQLFPVVVWAGIHFRQLISLPEAVAAPARGKGRSRKAARSRVSVPAKDRDVNPRT